MLTDPRRFSRIVAAVALILGPIVVLAGMIATPWEDEATTASYHDALAAHASQAEIAATLLHFGFVLLLPAALGLMHLARRATPKLAHIGGILAVVGLATLPGLLVTDFYDLALAQALPRAQSVAIADAAAGGLGRRAHGHLRRSRRCSSGSSSLVVAAVRAGVAKCWMPFALAIGWLLPFVVRHRARPGGRRRLADPRRARPVGVKVARMSDQAWAERPAGASRTTRAKAPKIAVESAA